MTSFTCNALTKIWLAPTPTPLFHRKKSRYSTYLYYLYYKLYKTCIFVTKHKTTRIQKLSQAHIKNHHRHKNRPH